MNNIPENDFDSYIGKRVIVSDGYGKEMILTVRVLNEKTIYGNIPSNDRKIIAVFTDEHFCFEFKEIIRFINN